MEWSDIPFDLQLIILKKSINLDIHKHAYKWKYANSGLFRYYSAEQVYEFFQMQNEGNGLTWFNNRSLIFKERRTHGIEILELTSVSGSINTRTQTYKQLKEALKLNGVKGYTKIKSKIDCIHALQKL